MRRCDQALQSLQAKPEQWEAQDDDGHNLLHWCALVGSEALVTEALRNRVPVGVQCKNGQTPLMWALTSGHLSVARQLLDAQADMHTRDSLGATPLMIATQHTGQERYQLLMMLVHRGGQEVLADKDCNGCTTAHWAAWKGDLTALKLLDGFSADLHTLDNGGMSPLHRAVMACQTRVVPFLLECNADPMQQTADGKTCFELRQPFDLKMEALLKGEVVEEPALREETVDDDGHGSDAEEPKQDGADMVETWLDDIQAAWLKPYYHEAVNSLMDVVGGEKKYGPQRGVNEPLMGAAAAPAQCVWEWGDDGL